MNTNDRQPTNGGGDGEQEETSEGVDEIGEDNTSSVDDTASNSSEISDQRSGTPDPTQTSRSVNIEGSSLSPTDCYSSLLARESGPTQSRQNTSSHEMNVGTPVRNALNRHSGTGTPGDPQRAPLPCAQNSGTLPGSYSGTCSGWQSSFHNSNLSDRGDRWENDRLSLLQILDQALAIAEALDRALPAGSDYVSSLENSTDSETEEDDDDEFEGEFGNNDSDR